MKIDKNLDKVCREMDFSNGKSVAEIPALSNRQHEKEIEMTESMGYTAESLKVLTGLGNIRRYRRERGFSPDESYAIYKNGEAMWIQGNILTYDYQMAEQIARYLRLVSDDEFTVRNPYDDERYSYKG